ncbi:uncharacterized protein F4812DRAFT_415634 [Daldinia caldariorum]|uniref:uncharacterized protein n=1 Tax=Daldinia caldariorum TaxID=326644 RepID=UPI00200846CF|nr:uncharacterized protein F4812DRAFT_415634 [Daldinia caldariorum]KAI1471822.1 hypothetical protein F4812DRAFT_415634 [Daldinia caldariorum]
MQFPPVPSLSFSLSLSLSLSLLHNTLYIYLSSFICSFRNFSIPFALIAFSCLQPSLCRSGMTIETWTTLCGRLRSLPA